MQSFTNLSAEKRRFELERLRIEHRHLLCEEKRKDFAKRPSCPYCKQTHVYKVGVNKTGRKRFKCSACNKSYTIQTGTCFHWLHMRSKFERYMYSMMQEGHRSLKSMSLEFNISYVTAFDWRHKILSSLRVSPDEFRGFVELRNTILPYSRKGIGKSKPSKKVPGKPLSPVHLIIAADSEQQKSVHVASIGQLRGSDIESRLKNRIQTGSSIVSRFTKAEDVFDAISWFGKKNKLSISRFDEDSNPNDYDDKNAKHLEQELRTLVFQKTRGVSTKYLDHYGRWATIMRTQKLVRDYVFEALRYRGGWAGYTAREDIFARFVKNHSEVEYIQTSHRRWKTAVIYKRENT